MKYHVIVSKRAVDDVIHNANWWAANHSQDKAIEWQIAIFEKIYSLDVMPESKPLAFENPDFPYELPELHGYWTTCTPFVLRLSNRLSMIPSLWPANTCTKRKRVDLSGGPWALAVTYVCHRGARDGHSFPQIVDIG